MDQGQLEQRVQRSCSRADISHKKDGPSLTQMMMMLSYTVK